MFFGVFFFQAEDGIRDLVRSRGLGDVYKRQWEKVAANEGESVGLGFARFDSQLREDISGELAPSSGGKEMLNSCLLYTSDAADERSSVDLGGRRNLKNKKK